MPATRDPDRVASRRHPVRLGGPQPLPDVRSSRYLPPAAHRGPGAVYRMYPIPTKVMIPRRLRNIRRAPRPTAGRRREGHLAGWRARSLAGADLLRSSRTWCLAERVALRSRPRRACADPSRQPRSGGRCSWPVPVLWRGPAWSLDQFKFARLPRLVEPRLQRTIESRL